MYQLDKSFAALLSDHDFVSLLSERQIGLEKESLRVESERGRLTQTPHPRTLGSALSHPTITTDFSEQMLEFATAPYASVDETLASLHAAHRFVAKSLGDEGEMLWAGSMPCAFNDESEINIADYGQNNSGMLKTVYRRGLARRYGRAMQVICGVHFNFSFSDDFWLAWGQAKHIDTLKESRSNGYLHIIRNLQRMSWLIPYFFGASPAVCCSFLQGQPHQLSSLDESTLYLPYATSLRMGDIGYSNNRQEDIGFRASYDTIKTYTNSLAWAMNRYIPHFADIGLVDGDDKYLQLNACLLQVENEYYSQARPKPLAEHGERPAAALRRSGVNYLELRPTDVDVREPMGVTREQLHFYEVMVLTCALLESPPLTDAEVQVNTENMSRVAHRGRDPELLLFTKCFTHRSLADMGEMFLSPMQQAAQWLDEASKTSHYSHALALQFEKLRSPELTPSAQILSEMASQGLSYSSYALSQSKRHQAYWQSLGLTEAELSDFQQQVKNSNEQFEVIENAKELPFDQYLAAYLAQVPADLSSL